MIQANQLRRRLESEPYQDLGAMMEGYAWAAVRAARNDYRRELDFSADSVEQLDEILVLVSESPDVDLEFEVRLWGSYFGELLRRRYAGSWQMTQYPGAAAPLPAVEARAAHFFPLAKVQRRLTLGDEEDLQSYYHRITTRLGNPSRVN